MGMRRKWGVESQHKGRLFGFTVILTMSEWALWTWKPTFQPRIPTESNVTHWESSLSEECMKPWRKSRVIAGIVAPRPHGLACSFTRQWTQFPLLPFCSPARPHLTLTRHYGLQLARLSSSQSSTTTTTTFLNKFKVALDECVQLSFRPLSYQVDWLFIAHNQCRAALATCKHTHEYHLTGKKVQLFTYIFL